MPEQRWKVGELAARTGLTIRTLHHYDAIGLLVPSVRTESAHGSGHRLYTAADVVRLHQIADVKSAMDAGVPPEDPKAQELAKRWLALVMGFTGGDPGIFNSLRNMYQSEENVAGMDVKAMKPMSDYIEKARIAAGIKHPGE
jgi:hypothetical protein